MSTEWEFLVALNERLRPLRDAGAIQEAAVGLIGEHLDASRVNYATRRARVMRLGESIALACRRGETVVVDDLQTDPRFTDQARVRLASDRISAFVAVPSIALRSEWHTPPARSRTSTSPARGGANSISATSSGAPTCSRTAARTFRIRLRAAMDRPATAPGRCRRGGAPAARCAASRAGRRSSGGSARSARARPP